MLVEEDFSILYKLEFDGKYYKMNLHIQLLKPDEIDLFNKEDEKAFNVHARYFSEGIVLGAAEDDREEYELHKLLLNPDYTVLSIYDDSTFAGGAIVQYMGCCRYEIHIFFLTVEYQSKGLGKTALDMVESYFPGAKTFRLITPSNVVRNTVFYVNKCGYKIVKVIGYDRESNMGDYVFEKNI